MSSAAKSLLCLCALLLLASCATPVAQRPYVSPEELRVEEEIERKMVDDAAQKGGLPRPWRNHKGQHQQFETVATRIEDAGAKVCQQMGLPALKHRCYFYFYISRSREINAHADGNNIVVNGGMLRFVQDDNELALIMGHEMAHSILGHPQAQTLNSVTGAFIGAMVDDMSGTRGYGTNGEEIGGLVYSQGFEAEADYVGLYITARAGYDISKAPQMFRRLSLEDPDGVYNGVTHPANPERVVALRKGIEEINYKRKHRLPLLPNMNDDPIEGDYEARWKP